MNDLRKVYRSLEDILRSNPLSIDGVLDDGWGERFAVKGLEIECAIMFADISRFSVRTASLDPAETLAFVNHFFTWISAEAVRHSNGIVDKYIGDEVMIVFPSVAGTDPVEEALRTAVAIAERDVFAFCPHIGLAAGPVILGYVGTPLSYNCSVFGSTVAVAARCVQHRPQAPHRASIVLPASLWRPEFGALFDSTSSGPWKVSEPIDAHFKGFGTVQIKEVIRSGLWLPQQSAEDRAREGVAALRSRRVENSPDGGTTESTS